MGQSSRRFIVCLTTEELHWRSGGGKRVLCITDCVLNVEW